VTGFLVVIGLGLLVAAFVIAGHLGRIADAVEDQNRFYGITDIAAENGEEVA